MWLAKLAINLTTFSLDIGLTIITNKRKEQIRERLDVECDAHKMRIMNRMTWSRVQWFVMNLITVSGNEIRVRG